MSKEAAKAKERGNAAYKKRDFAAARGHYDEAIHLTPREIALYSNKSDTFFEEGKYQDCIDTCMKAVTIGGEIKAQIAKAMARAGNAHAKLGHLSEALIWYEKSLAESHSREVLEKIAGIQEALVSGPKAGDFASSKPGKRSQKRNVPVPTPAPRRKPLSSTYITEIFDTFMQLPDTQLNAQRQKKVVYSSPTVTKGFLGFMFDYCIVPNKHHLAWIPTDRQIPITQRVKKTWKFISWITPFVRFLSVEDPPPSYFHSMLKSAGRFLNEFQYIPPEQPTEDVLSFVRSQVPHLSRLDGPPVFFQQIGAKKLFNIVGLRIFQISDFTALLESKRFSAKTLWVFHFGHLGEEEALHLNDVMIYLENSNIRMTQTEHVSLQLHVTDSSLPISRFIKAVRSVFPRVKQICVSTLYKHNRNTIFDLQHMETSYKHCRREIAKLPAGLHFHFDMREHVSYSTQSLLMEELRRKHESPNFTLGGKLPGLCMLQYAYVNTDQHIGNAHFSYKVEFSSRGSFF